MAGHLRAVDEPFPPVQHVVVHGYRRAFRMAGSGPVLLLLHGIGDCSETWQYVVPMLARQYTVIAPDLLGHGESDKPRADYAVGAYACGMRDLLDLLGIDRATVVGHSLGGGIAAQFSYQFPERCERLVIVSSGGMGRGVHWLLRMATAPGSELALPVATSGVVRRAVRLASPVLSRRSPFGLGLARDLTYLLRQYDELTDATARRAFLRTLRAVVDIGGQVVTMLDRAYLASELPTLIVWGAHDPIIPVAHAALAHDALPSSRLQVMAQSGHFPHRSEPTLFFDTVHDFMRTTEPATVDQETRRQLLRRGTAGFAADEGLIACSGV